VVGGTGAMVPDMDKSEVGRIGLWTFMLDRMPRAQAEEAAREAEELGYSTLWLPEAVGRDPLILSTMLLAATERLVLATGIANIFARDAMTMANSLRTLEEAFPGRFVLGLGVSHHHLVERLRKHDYTQPLTRMRDYLTFMKEKGAWMSVGPKELPDRVVLAALGPKMLELAAAETAGAHPYFATAEHTAMAREIMGPDALLAPEQMCILCTDPDEARARARKVMPTYKDLPNYANNLRRLGFGDDDLAGECSDRLVDAIIAWGDEEAIEARVRQHFDAGADHVCVQVLADDPDEVRAGWRRLAPVLLA
jgi:probable F420-dependent oxidoreductase